MEAGHDRRHTAIGRPNKFSAPVLKDIAMGETAIVVALIAAAVSLTSLLLTASLTESRDRRRALWERELERFFELEEIAGILVENVLSYRARSETMATEIREHMEFLQRASGRFQRYSEVSSSIRDLHHAVALFLSQNATFDNSTEFKQARQEITDAFNVLLDTSDRALGRTHKRLGFWRRWHGR